MTRAEEALRPQREDEPETTPAGPSWRSRSWRWWRERPVWACLVIALAVGAPLLVAVAALHRPHWYPVLDLAMTEFRVRDVGTAHTPLIGLPGRIGTYPDQGSHPGPLSFYVLAPTYRLLGSSSWALEAATVAIHVAAIATALWLGHRVARWRGVAFVTLLMAVVVRGYGQVPLTQPWNPYLPMVAWIVVLLSLWAVFCGDDVALVPLVVAATYCAQTHVPYLPLGAGMAVIGLGFVALRILHPSVSGKASVSGNAWAPETLASTSGRRRRRSLASAVAAGVMLWLPPVADQIRHDPGNIRQLIDHFGSPPESAVGVGEGVKLALRHLDVWAGLARQFTRTGTFISAASATRGLGVLVVWIAAAVVALRIGSRRLRALHAVVGLGLVLGTISMARIFGRPWYYLTLWAWGVTTLLTGAVVWTAFELWQQRRTAPPDDRRRRADALAAGAAALAAVVTVAGTVAFADAHHPEERLSAAVGALAGPTYDAVVDGVGAADGPDARYIVRWSDAADIGSPGFGLLNELERRGLDVGADTYLRVPVTPYRVRPRASTVAQIHLATGSYIDVWRAVPDAVEVTTYDPRTPAERAEFDDVHARLAARLADERLDDLIPLIDSNLFGMSVDPGLSAADQADIGRLIDLGQPMAVFIAPPPSDEDPTAL